jgi:hypothetical protein
MKRDIFLARLRLGASRSAGDAHVERAEHDETCLAHPDQAARSAAEFPEPMIIPKWLYNLRIRSLPGLDHK